MIAFLRDEFGAGFVADSLLDTESQCYAHAINLCEVFYDFHRASGQREAADAIADLARIGVIEDASLATAVWQSVGVLKANLRRVSLADCFAVELTMRLRGTLVTADRHELKRIADENLCPVLSIR